MAKLLVLIADIKASKEVREADREQLQERLEDLLEALSKENESLISPYTITLGDEFQAVFENAEGVFSDLWKIMETLYPVAVRFSLGIGAIDTPINAERAIGMDGPAFHEAREGMEILKGNGFLFNIRFEEDNKILNVINGSFRLISQQMQGWKKKRFSILQMLSRGHDYKMITQKLDISRAAFYKNKDAGSLDIIHQLSMDIEGYINQKLKS